MVEAILRHKPCHPPGWHGEKVEGLPPSLLRRLPGRVIIYLFCPLIFLFLFWFVLNAFGLNLSGSIAERTKNHERSAPVSEFPPNIAVRRSVQQKDTAPIVASSLIVLCRDGNPDPHLKLWDHEIIQAQTFENSCSRYESWASRWSPRQGADTKPEKDEEKQTWASAHSGSRCSR